MMKLQNWIGWRKLGFAVILTTISTVALFMSVATFDQWAEFQKWVYTAYAATNVGEYFGKRFGLKHEVETIKVKKHEEN